MPRRPVRITAGMHGAPVAEVLLLLVVGMPLALVARRLGLSALVAYLATGGVVAAAGWTDPAEVAPLAEMGASLLLFSLGLELDLLALRRRLRQVLIGAFGQICTTAAAGFGVMLLLDAPWRSAFVVGACLALSSTLIVLRALDEQRLRNREEGQTVLGLLLAQDMSLAPLMLVLSLVLRPEPGTPAAAHAPEPWLMALGIVLVVAATVLMRRALASRLLARIRGAQVPELEVAFSVTAALGAAWLTEQLGLGTAVGAFCAGLALGGDEHRHAIETATRPLQGLMAIIFFIAIGLQFDHRFVLANPALVLGGLVVSVVIKSALAGFALRLGGLPLRSAIGAGIMVGQVGEFSFVLAAHAYRGGAGPLDSETYRLIVAVACLSLAATPALVVLAQRFLPRSSLADVTRKGEVVVVAGLGPVGNTVVEALHRAGHPLLLVDRNEKLLEPWRGVGGIRLHLGRIEDMEDWLPALGERPRVVILTFPIPDTSAVVADRLRRMDPSLVIIARSPFTAQVDILRNAGVQHVICDEEATANALGPLLASALGTERRDATTAELQPPPEGQGPRPG